jgi:outer membrane immunogenic protein
MRKIIVSGLIGLGLSASWAMPSHAATLDDVMRELKSLRQENAAIRRELARIRKGEKAEPRQAARPRTAPVRNTPQETARTEPETFSGSGVSPRSTYAPVRGGTYDWGGFYAGLNLGYGYGKSVSTITENFGPGAVLSAPQSSSLSGFIGGIQLGYNFQNGPWVIGLEGDVQYADISGPQKPNSVFDLNVGGTDLHVFNSANAINSFGTIRGRLGYAFDRFLPYVTGGLAAGMSHSSGAYTIASFPGVIPGSTGLINYVPGDRLHIGWALGGGFEYGLPDGWSVKTEYLHIDLGEENAVPNFTSTKLKFDLVRGGVNYHF